MKIKFDVEAFSGGFRFFSDVHFAVSRQAKTGGDNWFR